MQQNNVHYIQPWLKPVSDTSALMAEFRSKMAERAEIEDRMTASRVPRPAPVIDEALLDTRAMEELMLHFCHEPYGQPVRRLAKLSIMFLVSPHYEKAVNMAWRDIDFFGVSPIKLHDSRPIGLLPALAWTPFKGKMRGVDREGAKIAILRPDGSTSTLQTWRPHPCPGTVPFWESKALGGSL